MSGDTLPPCGRGKAASPDPTSVRLPKAVCRSLESVAGNKRCPLDPFPLTWLRSLARCGVHYPDQASNEGCPTDARRPLPASPPPAESQEFPRIATRPDTPLRQLEFADSRFV